MASGCGAGTFSFPSNVVQVQLGLACFLRSPSPISLWYFIWVFTCFITFSVLILFLLSNEFSFSVTGASVLLVVGLEARGWVLLVAGVGARAWVLLVAGVEARGWVLLVAGVEARAWVLLVAGVEARGWVLLVAGVGARAWVLLVAGVEAHGWVAGSAIHVGIFPSGGWGYTPSLWASPGQPTFTCNECC